MGRWLLCQVSPLSLPGAAAPQFWGEGELPSQHFPLTLSKPLTRTEAVRQAQAGAVPPCWPLVTLHKACLCYSSSPRGAGRCMGGGGVSCKSILSPVPQGPHSAQPGTRASCPQREELTVQGLLSQGSICRRGSPSTISSFPIKLPLLWHPLSTVYHRVKVICMITKWKKHSPKTPATR